MNAPEDRLRTALADRYSIERELGQGGMATVYLAQDLKHDRKVAVKVLKPELAAVLGAERFVVEIKTTASLSHPHILPLFDSGTADGFLFYVMPYIEGETLRSKLDRETQLGVDEAVRIACEVADALGYAHRHGVIHRDIKPENILMHDGRPMVADFGIALAVSAAAGGRMTETGLSLGTPHYMSPEQATAEKEITGRSDIYSLASVLYEMLAGNPPHVGASAQQIIMKIIAEPVEAVTKFRKSVPTNVAAATARALEKLPADRFENASAFVLALKDPRFAGAETSGTGGALGIATSGGRRAFAGMAGIAALAVLVALWALLRPTAEVPTSRFVVKLRPNEALAYMGSFEPPRLALTPDGRDLVLVSDSAYARRALRLRRLGELASVPIQGTEDARSPAISPDGEQVAFVALKSIASARPVIRVAALRGGTAVTVVDSGFRSSPAWGPDGFIYFIGEGDMIRRVPASGGPIEDVVRLPALSATWQYAPWLRILPGGRGALVGEAPRASMDPSSGAFRSNLVRAIDLRSGRAGGSVPGTAGEYVADAGALIHVTADAQVMATLFDERTLETRGRPLALFGNVDARTPRPDLAIGGGNVVYTTPGSNAPEQVVWASRGSDAQTLVDSTWKDPEFESFSLSPDGRQLAVTIRANDGEGRLDVWLKPIDRAGALTRLTFGGSENKGPSWIGDGSHVSYLSLRDGRPELWRRRADGTGVEERVVTGADQIVDAVWTRDGRWLVATIEGAKSFEISALQVGSDSVLRPLLADPFDEAGPAISPDGRWLAYMSTESRTQEIYVRPFPRVQDGKWLISNAGGIEPVWSRDGRELFYRSFDGSSVFVVDMTKGPSAVTPRSVHRTTTDRVLESNEVDRMFDIAPDGRRFLLVRQGKGDISGDLVVVLNFAAELRAALKGGRP